MRSFSFISERQRFRRVDASPWLLPCSRTQRALRSADLIFRGAADFCLPPNDVDHQLGNGSATRSVTPGHDTPGLPATARRWRPISREMGVAGSSSRGRDATAPRLPQAADVTPPRRRRPLHCKRQLPSPRDGSCAFRRLMNAAAVETRGRRFRWPAQGSPMVSLPWHADADAQQWKSRRHYFARHTARRRGFDAAPLLVDFSSILMPRGCRR